MSRGQLPAQYLVRPPLVVDCSVLSSAIFEEESREVALDRLKGKTLHAPISPACPE